MTLSPNGIDFYPIGTITCFSPVELGSPTPKWVRFDAALLNTEGNISIPCQNCDILSVVDTKNVVVRYTPLEHEKDQLYCGAVWNKTERCVHVKYPNFQYHGIIRIELSVSNAIISEATHVMTFDIRRWNLNKLSTTCIGIGQHGKLDIFGDGIYNTQRVSVR